MTTIDDLGYKSITEMSTDESLELIRQIRLSRLTPKKPTKKATKKSKSKAVPTVNADQAAELLKILGG